MKHVHILTLSVVTFASQASADCPDMSNSVNEVLAARLGPTYMEEYLLAAYPAAYRLGTDQGWDSTRGINDFLDITEEAGKQMLATILATQGVEGLPPPVWQDPATSRYEYNPQGFYLGQTFFRSEDSWGPLSFDVYTRACTFVDALTGAPSCDEPFWPSKIRHYYSFGADAISGILDTNPNSAGTTAQFHSIWDLFKDPDWELQYHCGSFDDPDGVIYTARTLIHENWHATGIGHVDGPSGSCTGGPGRCDTFVSDLGGATRRFAGAALLAGSGLGSYQIDQMFMCDLVEDPGDWMPLMVRMAMNEHFWDRANQSRFVNTGQPGTSSSGLLPFRCGLPQSAVDAYTGGTSSCSGLSCVDSTDCSGGDICEMSTGCCEQVIVK